MSCEHRCGHFDRRFVVAMTAFFHLVQIFAQQTLCQTSRMGSWSQTPASELSVSKEMSQLAYCEPRRSIFLEPSEIDGPLVQSGPKSSEVNIAHPFKYATAISSCCEFVAVPSSHWS